MAYAYVPVRPMSMSSSPSWYGPRYDTSCRESIEDLKALIDITQSLRHDNNTYTCETCARTFNEEVILKLINALIVTATRNCGLDGHHQPHGSNNIGVWNAGGGYMGGNTIVVGAPVTVPGAGVTEPTNTSEESAIDEALIRLGVLDGENTVGLGIGDTDVLEANVGNIVGKRAANNSNQNETVNKDDSLVKVGVLDGKNTVGIDVGSRDVAEVNVANIVGGQTTTNNNKVASGVTNDVPKIVNTVPTASDKPVADTPASARKETVSTASNSTTT